MDNLEQVSNVIKNNSQGVVIKEIEKKTNLGRHAILICLARLEGGQKITVRKVGPSKLCFWNHE